jgi:nucleoside-diphosphate-sugar epimerase
MRVIIAGSTGMIGRLILNHCLVSDEIREVISFVRKPSDKIVDRKLKEVVLSDFEDYSEHYSEFENVSVAFFCIGAYTGQVSDQMFKKITVNYAVKFASALKRYSNNSTFCLLSGAGADRSEKSKTAFAKYKGMAENKISEMKLKFYSFRPGYIYPTTVRKEPNLIYKFMRFSYPLIRLFGNNVSIKSTELAQAMFNVGLCGADKEILENKDIMHQIKSLSSNVSN